MLSQHEISTLLLVQSLRCRVESCGADLFSLQHRNLVDVKRLCDGSLTAHLTWRGQALLRRLEGTPPRVTLHLASYRSLLRKAWDFLATC